MREGDGEVHQRSTEHVEEKRRKRGRPRINVAPNDKEANNNMKRAKREQTEPKIQDLRLAALEREQKRLSAAQKTRELLIKELLHLEAAGSSLTFDSRSQGAVEAFSLYENPNLVPALGSADTHATFGASESFQELRNVLPLVSSPPPPSSSTALVALQPNTGGTTTGVPPPRRRRGRPSRSRDSSSESELSEGRPLAAVKQQQQQTQGGVEQQTQAIPSSSQALATEPTLLLPDAGDTTADLAERASRDAAILSRVLALQREGLWSAHRLPKEPEPPRRKVHWDHLLEEMAWLAKDFAEERKWKMALARKVSRQVLKYHRELKAKDVLKVRKEEQQTRKLASNIARDVMSFWASMEKLVVHKHQSQLDAKKKQALHKHLDFLVDQTQRYSSILAQDLNAVPGSEDSSSTLSPPSNKAFSFHKMNGNEVGDNGEHEASPTALPTVSYNHYDREFVDHSDENDDETTLVQEEEEEGMEGDDEARIARANQEIARLKAESEMSLEELLATYHSETAGEDGDEDMDGGDDGDDVGSLSPERGSTLSNDNSSESENPHEGEDQQIEGQAFGTELLLQDETEELSLDEDEVEQQKKITAASAAANAAQPTGITLSTTKVKTKVPFLLKHTLREYQHIGLDWLVTMYEKRLNGILADEMGLGKTIQTIALLAHLACEKKIWGPHLIVVPTSVMLNWDRELRKWCPAFKILTYYGSPKERRAKRQGWSKPNSFHICITSYRLVLQDQQAFRRQKWKYLILDEAHHIKNFRSQRWQTLLNFNAKRRLLLTGTPLQNNLMELWSLMHFLMPHLFQSHSQFKKWFDKPVASIIEGGTLSPQNDGLIGRLHSVLRPFLLRRLKRDVEQQLPQKVEHIAPCRLSKRQRLLYEEFMAASTTRERLASGNFLSIVNVLMQLRKVCNHPDLFEPRPIVSPFDTVGIVSWLPTLAVNANSYPPGESVDFGLLNLVLPLLEDIAQWQADRTAQLHAAAFEQGALQFGLHASSDIESYYLGASSHGPSLHAATSVLIHRRLAHLPEEVRRRKALASQHAYVNRWRCSKRPLYGADLRRIVQLEDPLLPLRSSRPFLCGEIDSSGLGSSRSSSTILPFVLSLEQRTSQMIETIQRFVCVIPTVRAVPPSMHCSHPDISTLNKYTQSSYELCKQLSPALALLRPAWIRQQIYFPDKRLLQYDCGKLQVLEGLLRKLKAEGHRALIFTQMARMLDVLEAFLNIHGHIYLRLDGATSIEQRQILMERFNQDSRIFLFILSTRTGGLGVNLTGADTVIFYDSDWNPAMDQQAQDRCHRIGQTREVHIYRLITKHTVEENILKKANQKRHLHEIVIGEGCFTTDFFKTLTVRDLLEDVVQAPAQPLLTADISTTPASQQTITQRDWEKAVTAVEDETDVTAIDLLRTELAADSDEFEESMSTRKDGELASNDTIEEEDAIGDLLTPIQRYAFRFLDVVNPIIDQSELKALHEEVEIDQKEWEQDVLARIRVEEEDRMDEDVLFYEPPGASRDYRAAAFAHIPVYAPPDPNIEELFIPSFDLENYPYTLSDLTDLSATAISCDEPSMTPGMKRKKKLRKAADSESNRLKESKVDGPPSDVSLALSRKHKRKRTTEEKKHKKSTDKQGALRKKRKHKEKDKDKEKDKEREKDKDKNKEKDKDKDKAKEKDKDKEKEKPRTKADKPKRTKATKTKDTDTKNATRRNRKARKGQELSFGPPWSETEDQVLLRAVNLFGPNWELISDVLSSAPHPSRRKRLPRQCLDRWRDVQPKNIGNPPAPMPGAIPQSTTPLPTVVAVPLSSVTTKSKQTTKKSSGLFPLLDLLDHRNLQRKKPTQRSTTTSSTSKTHEGTDKHIKQTTITDPPAHSSHAQASLACGITPENPVRTPVEVVLNGKRSAPLDTGLTPKLHHKIDTKLGANMKGPATMRGKDTVHGDNSHAHQHGHVHPHLPAPPHPLAQSQHSLPLPVGQTPGMIPHPSIAASPRAIKPFTANGGSVATGGNSVILNAGSTTQAGHTKFAQINQMMTQNMQLLAALSKPQPGLQPKPVPAKKGRQTTTSSLPTPAAGRGQLAGVPRSMTTLNTSAGNTPSVQSTPTAIPANTSGPTTTPAPLMPSPHNMTMPMGMGVMGMPVPIPMGIGMGVPVPLPVVSSNQQAPSGSGQSGATPLSTLLALYSITQLPASTSQIHEIIRRSDATEANKVELLRRVIQDHQEHTPKPGPATAPTPPPPPPTQSNNTAPP